MNIELSFISPYAHCWRVTMQHAVQFSTVYVFADSCFDAKVKATLLKSDSENAVAVDASIASAFYAFTEALCSEDKLRNMK
jgi:hypothetical protein